MNGREAAQTLLAPPEQQALEPAGSMTNLLSLALSHNAAIDVIERLAALQEKQWARESEIQFNEAMSAAQAEVGRIAPDQQATGGARQKWASYAKLDKVLRPIYIKHGFSLSFDSGPSPIPDTVIVKCYVSHKSGHTRTYSAPPMPSDGKGAKGGDVMNPTFATGAAMSYGARYLLKFIFNIAVGEDDPEANGASNGDLAEQIEWIANAGTLEELQKLYKQAYVKFDGNKSAQLAIVKAKDAKKRDFNAR